MNNPIHPKDPLEQWRAVRDAVKSPDAPLREENDPRALANIAQWREYLPADCVEAMVKDGWHLRV